MRARSRRRIRRVLTGLIPVCAALLLAALVVGLASASAARPRAGSPPPPPLPSSDPFYSYTGSIAGFAPGTVLRHRTVTLVGFATGSTNATQVLYRTTDELGHPSLAVATVIPPASGASAGPTRIVSYQTAYDTLGVKCDPSYAFRGGDPADNGTNDEEEKLVEAYVTAGDTVVVPDYEELSQDWTAGQESGYGTLDGIRAAESVLKLPGATTPVGMVGYSGGSIATDFAAELAPSYAPSLHIVGVAIGGVPVDYAHNLLYITGSPGWSGIIPAVIGALAHAFRADLTPYLSAYGRKLIAQTRGQCINNFFGAHPGLRYGQLLRPHDQNIFAIRPFAQIVNRLIMSRTGTPKAPMLIGVGNADGTGDGVMVAADDEALAHTYCQRGVSVEFQTYKGQTHTDAALAFEPVALPFLSNLLTGAPAPNNCSSIGPGNSITPLPLPPPGAKLLVRVRGYRARLHGVVVLLGARGGTVRNVRITLTRGRHMIASARLARVTAHRRRIVLRREARPLPHGRYTLTVTVNRHRILRRAVRV
jgi:hypothetical protein